MSVYVLEGGWFVRPHFSIAESVVFVMDTGPNPMTQ